MDLVQIIKQPLITEKTTALASQGKFTFKVYKKADKKSVKKAIEKFFKVEVKKVWLVKSGSKKKRVGKARKREITIPSWKKAIVKLAPGQRIDLFEVEGN